jgi:hypothetical protein
MPRVVPSAIVSFLKTAYPWLPDQSVPADPRDPGEVSGLLVLLDRVPDELFQLGPADFAAFIAATERLRMGIVRNEWRSFTGSEGASIRTIYRLLSTCPDAAPAAGTTDPAFISDPDLRADLRRDLGEVNRSLQNGEWKGATVLAGSIVEAVLLWALQNKKTTSDLQAAAASLGKKIDLTIRPIERWDLHELIEYAHATSLISDSTRTAADQGRDFRNLIHPGKAMRLAKKCNRATAHLGVGAVEAVIQDLS